MSSNEVVTPEGAAEYEDWGSRDPKNWKQTEDEVASWGDITEPKKDKPKQKALGDRPGHPFYGNQYTNGVGGVVESKKQSDGSSVVTKDGKVIGTVSPRTLTPPKGVDEEPSTRWEARTQTGPGSKSLMFKTEQEAVDFLAGDKASLDAHDPYVRSRDYASFEEKALEGIQKTSRTAKGVSDTSSSADKQKLAVEEGDKLAAKTAENVRGALRMAWNARDREFKSADEVHEFTEGLARQVSSGLLPAGQGLYRTWETPNDQTSPGEVKVATRKFSEQLYEKLDEDPVATAAWAEKQMAKIHPWADGVGRTTKVLGAFVLARGGLKPATYPDMKTYYAEIKKSPESWEKFYRTMVK